MSDRLTDEELARMSAILHGHNGAHVDQAGR